jgi:hypothetical protein
MSLINRCISASKVCSHIKQIWTHVNKYSMCTNIIKFNEMHIYALQYWNSSHCRSRAHLRIIYATAPIINKQTSTRHKKHIQRAKKIGSRDNRKSINIRDSTRSNPRTAYSLSWFICMLNEFRTRACTCFALFASPTHAVIRNKYEAWCGSRSLAPSQTNPAVGNSLVLVIWKKCAMGIFIFVGTSEQSILHTGGFNQAERAIHVQGRRTAKCLFVYWTHQRTSRVFPWKISHNLCGVSEHTCFICASHLRAETKLNFYAIFCSVLL